MRSFNIKSRLIILMLLASAIILTGCSIETYMKELVVLEKTKDHLGPSLIFESIEDKKYYLVEIDNYLYDNIEFEPNEIIEVKGEPEGQGFFDFFFNPLYGDEFEHSEEKIFILDEWRSLLIMTQYTKEQEID